MRITKRQYRLNGTNKSKVTRPKLWQLAFLLIALCLGSQNVLASERFSELSPAQQEVLAPLKDRWNTLPKGRRQQLAKNASRFAQLPPAKQEALRQSMRQFKELPPEERAEVRRRWQKDKANR